MYLLARAGLAVDAFTGAGFVFDFDADDLVALSEDVDHGGVGFDARAVFLGAGGVGHTEPEGVDRAVGYLDRAFDVLGEVGLDLAGLLGRKDLRRDAALPTALQFLLEVLVGVLGPLDEQPAGHLDTVAGDIAQHAVFFDTFFRTGLISNGVPTAAVQESVHSSCCPMGEVPLFDKGDLEAAHCEVSCDSAPGGTAPNDDNVWLVTHPFNWVFAL
jgi:hypothetical protein